MVRAAALNLAIIRVSSLFADHLDGYGDPAAAISPQSLLEMIRKRRNIILDALAGLDPAALAGIRARFRSLAPEFRRPQRDARGTWHPYREVLNSYPMARHRAHQAIVKQHYEWYKQSMDEAMDWLFGKPPA